MNLLSLLHFVMSRVSPGKMYGNLSKSLCIYLRILLFVRGCGLCFDWVGVSDEGLVDE